MTATMAATSVLDEQERSRHRQSRPDIQTDLAVQQAAHDLDHERCEHRDDAHEPDGGRKLRPAGV